ncbi:MAG: hypothetical protein NC038_01195 [Paludibacter sp.]|nr:hypothetical protein [Bacteroidales bacterium]MCM1068824.1 hypothetical protein [Prevotella sp.]MCM1353085.1 hypothetical protein [Bacteroides sp.]MCM1442407.1 hypothetical protein [Muribaculum sp.]MCM1481250.1 hypothetical protein [Paludibacter sp.]
MTVTRDKNIEILPAEGGLLVRNDNTKCLFRRISLPLAAPDSVLQSIRDATAEEIEAYKAKQ